MSLRPPVLILLALAGPTATPLGAAPDKSGFGLDNPTPVALLRELNSDRPDVTEGPFTVDAGHVQLEMDFVNYSTNEASGLRTRSWGLAPFNLRLGVRTDFELGLFVAPYMRQERQPVAGANETRAGFGDITLRAKYNFWGNDGGETAFGLIADLKLPTAADGLGNGAVEGTLILPVSVELGGGWDLGAMTGLDFLRGETGGRQCGWINSATIGHDLTKDLAGYVEVATETGAGSPVTTFDAGLTLKLDANTQLDMGAQFGLSRAADDTLIFTGLTRRY